MMFGLLTFVILGAAGLAIDFQRSNLVRTEIAEASDAALIAAARYKAGHPRADSAELTGVARKVFDNGFTRKSAIRIEHFEIGFDSARGTFSLDVRGKMNALIMGVLGNRYIGVDTRSEARLGKPPLLEVALALDVTGSMKQNGKMTTLKTAANDLVDTLFEAPGAKVKFSVVPFAQYVNVGIANRNAAWLSGTGPGWVGCVGSRDYPLNVEDSNYLVNTAPGVIMSVRDPAHSVPTAIQCPTALLPLTDDKNLILASINGLTPQGYTYIPSGLSWGWATLTPDVPFTEGLDFAALESENGTKALILMTDGDNTRAPTYPLHESTADALADQMTRELCVNIKNQKIVLYTIAFQITDPVIKGILENCATTRSHYYDAADSDGLIDAFASIGNSLRGISLSK